MCLLIEVVPGKSPKDTDCIGFLDAVALIIVLLYTATPPMGRGIIYHPTSPKHHDFPVCQE